MVEVDSEVTVDPPTVPPEAVLPEPDEAVPVTTLRAPPPSPSATSRPSPLWVLERDALVPGRSRSCAVGKGRAKYPCFVFV